MAKMQTIPDGEYLKGLSDVTARMGELIAKQENLTEGTMLEIVTDIRQRAADLAPKDTGTLRGTAYENVSVSGEQVTGSVHFPEKYAAKQHEHVEFFHEDGEAKFLEKAMLEKADQYRQKLAEDLRALFGGG